MHDFEMDDKCGFEVVQKIAERYLHGDRFGSGRHIAVNGNTPEIKWCQVELPVFAAGGFLGEDREIAKDEDGEKCDDGIHNRLFFHDIAPLL